MRARVRQASILLVASAAVVAACSQYEAPTARAYPGAYRGTDEDGVEVTLEVHRDDHFAFGHGGTGGGVFAIAVLGPWGGPTLVRYLEGPPAPAGFERSSSGIDLDLTGGEAVSLVRESPSSRTCGGSYAGRFSIRKPVRIELELWQWGELVAGHGKLAGQAAAIAGWARADEPARLGVLLADLTRFDLEAELRGRRGRRLALPGLRPEIVLKRRQGGCP